MTAPLTGVGVVDLARLLPGDYGTAVLADLGADVLKVEQPGVGDGLRLTPPHDEDGASGAHGLLNRGKRSVTLDLKRPEGREVLLDLVAGADVLVDSFRPGVMDRLGLGHETLDERHPRLVHVSLTFHGHTSPSAARAGHDLNAQALAGLLELADGPDGGPALPYVQAADHAAGLQVVVAALAGLRDRDRTGRGGFWDVSMVDAAYSLLGLAAAGYAAAGTAPPRRATLTGGLACYGLYACADGEWVAVGALEPVFFERLVTGLGLAADLVPSQYVPEAQAALRRQVAAAFSSLPRPEWLRRLEPADCCVTPVNDVRTAMDGAATSGRPVVRVTGRSLPRLGPVPLAPGTDAAEVAARPAPALGADTDEVLRSLGRSAEQVSDLRHRGVV